MYKRQVYWVSQVDTTVADTMQLPNRDSLVIFRIVPSDGDRGIPIVTDTFRVDNYHSQKVVISEFTNEQSGDVVINYQITDPTKDTLYIKCKYRRKGETAWSNPTISGDTNSLVYPYLYNLTWHSRNELNHEDTTVEFRIIPYDNWDILDTLGKEDTIEFHLDNNYPPVVNIDSVGKTSVTGEQSDSVVVYFTVIDSEGDSIEGFVTQYSFDELTWSQAVCSIYVDTEYGDTTLGHLVWYTLANNLFGEYDLYFGLSACDKDTGERFSYALRVDNYHNQKVEMVDSLDPLEASGDVYIPYTIIDTIIGKNILQERFKIEGYYSFDGNNFNLTLEETRNCDTSYSNDTLLWSTDILFPGIDSIVWFEIKITDYWDYGKSDTIVFRLDNNSPPQVVALNNTASEYAGEVKLRISFNDVENDSVGFLFSYARGDGDTWCTPGTCAVKLDTVIWYSQIDIPDEELTSVKFKVTPFDEVLPGDIDTGISGVISNLHVDNYHNHKVEITPLTGVQTGQVRIEYLLSDSFNDILSIRCEYMANVAQGWLPAHVIYGGTSYENGVIQNIDSTQYDSAVIWDSYQDLPAIDQYVWFRITPSDGWLTANADSIQFRLLNSQKPTMMLATPTGEQTDSVHITYHIYSTGGVIACSVRYEIQGRNDTQAHVFFDDTIWFDTVSGIDESEYEGEFIWLTEMDLPDSDVIVKFLARPWRVGDTTISGVGDWTETGTFRVDNYHKQYVSITKPDTEVSGLIPLSYEIIDTSGDTITLVCEYSLDSSTWYSATMESLASKIGPAGYIGDAYWNSEIDLRNLDVNVYFRVRPWDGSAFGNSCIFTLHVDNNPTPIAYMLGLAGASDTVSCDVTLYYCLEDNGDTLKVTPQYSFDTLIWWTATVYDDTTTTQDDTDKITPPEYPYRYIIWNSFQDTFSYVGEVWFRLLPQDNDIGECVPKKLYLINNSPPQVVIESPEQELSSLINLRFTVRDTDKDSFNFAAYYSINQYTWQTAYVVDYTNISEDTWQLAWQSDSNLKNYDGKAWFILQVNDGFHIVSDTTDTLYIDNVPLAQLVLVLPRDSVVLWSTPVEIKFTLPMDTGTFYDGIKIISSELDTHEYTFEYVADSNLLTIYPTFFTSKETVWVRLTTDLHDTWGDPVDTTTWKFYTTWLADYTLDGAINFYDLAKFSVVWGDTYNRLYELGPAKGTVPYLEITPDGKLDANDAVVFCDMWDYAVEHGLSGLKLQSKSKGTQGFAILDEGDKVYIAFMGREAQGIALEIIYDHKVLKLDKVRLSKEFTEQGEFIFARKYEIGDTVRFYGVKFGKANNSRKMELARLEFTKELDAKTNIEIVSNIVKSNGKIFATRNIIEVGRKKPPEITQIKRCIPNPFVDKVKIEYTVGGYTSKTIEINIYDVTGRKVKELLHKKQEPGCYAIEWKAEKLPAGIFFAVIKEENKQINTHKLILLK